MANDIEKRLDEIEKMLIWIKVVLQMLIKKGKL